MKPHFAAALLTALFVAGCATTITSPTPVADTDMLAREFSSQVVPGGSASRGFELSAAGSIAVTLVSTSPPGVMLGVGVGIPRSNGSCALQTGVETVAGSTAHIATAADTGPHCVKVYDIGTLQAPLPFTISISHP